ncbi:transcriptional regulator [Stappia sp. 22II-S9-Z10]|nr:transcriptional regulator [Stappia sp. 22II-S9-Z10]
MEDALGLSLFEREVRRLKLSPAGEILFRHTRRITTPLESAMAELDMLRGLRTGQVRIATIESVGLSFLPDLIAEFGSRHPRIHMDVAVLPAADVLSRLVAGEVDVGFSFIAAAPPPRIEVALRRDVRIGVLMVPDHPLAAVPNLTIADCLSHPLAVAKPEISIRSVIEPFMARAMMVQPPMVEADSIRMLVELARSGRYASVMTPIGAQGEIASGSLTFRRLEDPGLPANRFALVVSSGGELRYAPAAFYEHAKHFMSTIELPGAL